MAQASVSFIECDPQPPNKDVPNRKVYVNVAAISYFLWDEKGGSVNMQIAYTGKDGHAVGNLKDAAAIHARALLLGEK